MDGKEIVEKHLCYRSCLAELVHEIDTALAQAKAEKCCNHEEEIARLTTENAKLQEDIRIMVEKAADKSLSGYRELGARAAKAENASDALRMEIARLQAERDALNEAGEALHSKLREMTDDLRACVKALRECEPSMRKWAVLPIMEIQDALNRPTIRKLLSSE